MEQQHTPSPPPAAPAPPAPIHPQPTSSAPPDRRQWTPAKQRIFLSALMETGSVARAAQAVNMSRPSAYCLRRRLAGTPFDRTWDLALNAYRQRLADPFGRAPSVASQERR